MLVAGTVVTAAGPMTLWQIGAPDNGDAEFALAPQGYQQFKEDGFFVVGRSDAKIAWPYVHPGPLDGWAGNRRHVFTVVGLTRDQVNSGGDPAVYITLPDAQKLQFDLSPPAARVNSSAET